MNKPIKRAQRVNLEQFMSKAATNPRETVRKVLILASYRTNNYVSHEIDNLELSKATGKRVACDTLMATNYIKEAHPRGMPWSHFPIVSEPWYVFKPISKAAYITKEKSENSGLRMLSALLEMNEIIPDYHYYAIEVQRRDAKPLEVSLEIYKLAYAIKKLGNQNAPVFLKIIHQVNGVDKGDWAEVNVDDLLKEHGPYATFMYSYALNFRAIAMKALKAVTNQETLQKIRDKLRKSWDEDVLSDDLYDLSRASWHRLKDGKHVPKLEHPLCVQALYLLKKHGPIPTVSGEEMEEPENSPQSDQVDQLFNAMFLQSFTIGRDSRPTFWNGSGKYPSAVLCPFADIGTALLGTGLIEFNDRQEFCISDSGSRFLESIHPDCEDVDVVLRWIDPTTGYVNPNHETSMDDWLMRHFKKMKTKVNKINADLVAPSSADDETLSTSYPFRDLEAFERQWFGDVD